MKKFEKHFSDSGKIPQAERNIFKTEEALPDKRLGRPQDLEECEKNWNQFRENVGTTLRTISETQQVVKKFNNILSLLFKNLVFYTGRAIIEQVHKKTKRDIITRSIEGRLIDDFATHSLQSNMSNVTDCFPQDSEFRQSLAIRSTTEM